MDRDPRLESAILRVLAHHRGQKNRIPRPTLVDWLRSNAFGYITDRDVRSAIENLRRGDDHGALICSSSGTGGYWLAEDLGELLASYQEERRRCLTEMVTIRERLRRGKAVLGGQLRMI